MDQKALIYCRVSDKKQVTDGDGLHSQEARCREYAARKNYEVEKVFHEKGKSGALLERRAMKEMLRFLRQNKKEHYVVVIDDISRLARGLETHLALRAAIKNAGGKLESPSLKFANDSKSRLLEHVLASVVAHNREDNAEQVKNRMWGRLMNGYWVFHAPIGYRYVPKANCGKILIRDEPVASIIQEAMEGFASGRFETITELKRFLESYPEYPKNDKSEVPYGRIEELLARVHYAGYIDVPDWGINFRPAQHEPLVSFETWQKVQERLKAEAKAPARKDISEDFPLRGFVTCACCGDPMTSCWSKGRNGKYPYYYCQHKTCDLYGKTIRRDKIEAEFEELLSSLQPSKDLFDMATAMFKKLWNAGAKRHDAENKTLKLQLQKLDQKTEQFLERIVETDNATVISAYEKQIRKLDEEKTELQEKIKNCGRPLKSFDETYRTAMGFLGNPHEIWINGSLEDKRNVLKLVFAEKLQYSKNEGYRTAATSLPFRVLEGLQEGNVEMVPQVGLEPTHLSVPHFECGASTNFTTGAQGKERGCLCVFLAGPSSRATNMC